MSCRAASGGPADVSRAKLLKKFDQNFFKGARQSKAVFPLFISVIAGFIASCIEKKDSTFTLLRQNRSYCDMH